MKVIDGGFGKKEEQEEQIATASDACQAVADMLSDMEMDAETFTEPECVILLAWKGVPALIAGNVESEERVSCLLDFAKMDVLGAIANREAQETGIYGDDDDTVH